MRILTATNTTHLVLGWDIYSLLFLGAQPKNIRVPLKIVGCYEDLEMQASQGHDESQRLVPAGFLIFRGALNSFGLLHIGEYVHKIL